VELTLVGSDRLAKKPAEQWIFCEWRQAIVYELFPIYITGMKIDNILHACSLQLFK